MCTLPGTVWLDSFSQNLNLLVLPVSLHHILLFVCCFVSRQHRPVGRDSYSVWGTESWLVSPTNNLPSQCCIFRFELRYFKWSLTQRRSLCIGTKQTASKKINVITSELVFFSVVLIFSTLFFCCSELIEFARKSVISRVVELTDDRTALKLEVSSLQETVSRLESRIKEREEEAKRFETFDIVIFYRNATLQC